MWFDYIKTMKDAGTLSSISPSEDGKFTALYPDFPERFTYDHKKGWSPRKKGNTLGRMYAVHPGQGESFYFRMLLSKVPANELCDEDKICNPSDLCSMRALKWVDGVEKETYKAACIARNLLQDDSEWVSTMDDAVAYRMPSSIRALFSYIVAFNNPNDPSALFEQFVEPMGDDFCRQFEQSAIAFSEVDVRSCVLLDVEERVKFAGTQLDQLNVTMDDEARRRAVTLLKRAAHTSEPKEIRDELIAPEDREEMATNGEACLAILKPSQSRVARTVLESIETKRGGLFFVDAMGGAGKTYTINTIMRVGRSKGCIILAVASSGIAAILLDLGRTFHSRFKAERLHPAPEQRLNIKAQTTLAELLRRADAIIWDEAAMGNKYHMEALDLTLRDFMKAKDPRLESVPFGGKTIVLAGDFRQTLPIVRFASRAQIIDVAMSRSALWKRFTKMSLEENMRIENARKVLLDGVASAEDIAMLAALERFAEWLLQIGNGTDPTTDELCNVALPSELCLPEGCDMDALIKWVYPNLETNGTNVDWLSGRAILAPYNSEVDRINQIISDRFPGSAWKLQSADAVTDPKDAYNITPEFLNTIELSGMPQHELHLKKNMVVMLLRNLSPIEGLCNGTRLLVQDVINGRLLRAVIATGSHKGDVVFIPRIKLSPDEGAFPFEWSRLQFPVRIAFAMT